MEWKWLDMVEEQPKHNQQCLFWANGQVCLGVFTETKMRFYAGGQVLSQARWWMPPPPPPPLENWYTAYYQMLGERKEDDYLVPLITIWADDLNHARMKIQSELEKTGREHQYNHWVRDNRIVLPKIS